MYLLHLLLLLRVARAKTSRQKLKLRMYNFHALLSHCIFREGVALDRFPPSHNSTPFLYTRASHLRYAITARAHLQEPTCTYPASESPGVRAAPGSDFPTSPRVVGPAYIVSDISTAHLSVLYIYSQPQRPARHGGGGAKTPQRGERRGARGGCGGLWLGSGARVEGQ